ncbi:unnamed protein product [Notodromas monacha]|uniref:Uncharacterized protein n=1 Tax=Notodromas monacha TaxID=399045 RepID=A0A7R9BUS0_9CRUS|nr:unnamed protein product [Notodromas monacha]CAG0921154.1 unnamed protein product [Notodromas monacha]
MLAYFLAMALPGLPPLPKSLSVLISNDQQHRARVSAENNAKSSTVTNRTRELMAQFQSSDRPQPSARGVPPPAPPRPSRLSASPLKGTTGPTPAPKPLMKPPQQNFRKFDSQMGQLRREMDGLRQMDLSLLYQLWSLNDSIQEYKQVVEAERAWESEALYSDATMDEIYERGPPCGNGDNYSGNSSRDASRIYDSIYENSGSTSSIDYSSFKK